MRAKTSAALMNQSYWFHGMVRLIITAVVGGYVAVGGAAFAHEDAPVTAPSALVKRLLAVDLPDMAGKRATMITVDYAPGQASEPHVHPGSAFAYVLQGRVESQLGGEKPVVYTRRGSPGTKAQNSLT